MIERNTAVSTLDELIKELTEIRDTYGDSKIPLYVKTHGWDELLVSVEREKLTDSSEVYNVIIGARTHAASSGHD